jgi:hypothetical protein
VTLALSTQQDGLVRRGGIAAITLVKLQLYLDRAAGTLPATGLNPPGTFYFANRPCSYDYGNTGTDRDFWPFLLGVSDLVASMSHIPGPSGLETIAKPIEIRLANEITTQDGTRLSEYLRNTYRLENATVEVSQILLDRHSGARQSLAGLAGDEHTVLYRGRVQRVGPVTEEHIVLQCQSDRPTIPWVRSDDATAVGPASLGVRAPLPYGAARKVAATAFATGAATNLTADLAAADTTLTGADFSRFPTAGSAMIGSEEIAWTGKTASTLTGVTRGQNDTAAGDHQTGARVAQIAAEKHVVGIAAGSLSNVSRVGAVYAAHPLRRDELVQLVPGRHYSITFDDTTLRSGYAATYVSVSVGQLRTLLQDLTFGRIFDSDATATPVVDQTITGSSASVSVGAITDVGRLVDGTTSAGSSYTGMPKSSSAFITFARPANASEFVATAVRIRMSSSSSSGELAIWDMPFGSPDRTQISSLIAVTASGVVDWTIPAGYEDLLAFDLAVFDGSTVRVVEVQLIADYTEIDPSNITSAQETFPLRIYADVEGPIVPNLVGTWAQIHDFDAGTWTDGVIDTTDKDEGTGSLRVDSVFDYDDATGSDQFNEADNASDWSLVEGNVISISDDAVVQLSGSAVKFALGFPSIPANGEQHRFTSSSWSVGESSSPASAHAFRFKFRFDSKRTTGNRIFRAILRSGSASIWWDISIASLSVDTWYEAILPLDDFDGSSGSFVYTVIDGFDIDWDQCFDNGDNVWLDDKMETIVRAQQPPTVEAYRSGISSEDWSSPDDAYRLDVMADDPDSVATLWFSDDATPSPKPTDRVELSDLVPGSPGIFVETTRISAEVGTPDATAVQTMGITFVPPPVTVGRIVAAHPAAEFSASVWIDDLESGSDVTGLSYLADLGDLIEHPADVFRHFVEVVLGRAVDETSVVAAQTNLGGTAKLAADLRAFGLTPEDVLARLAFESRANIVPDETAAGTVWRFLTAETDYGFPAASLAITEWDKGGTVELGLSLEELGTRWVAHYAPDASLPEGDEAFTQIALANPDTSDVSVTTTLLGNAEAAFGRLDAQPFAFLAHQDEDTLEEVFGYYVSEGIRAGHGSVVPAALIAISGIPWWDGYALQVGDLRNVTLPWRTSAKKVRVIETRKSFETEQVEIRAVEVT